jgi:tricorn protease
MQNQPTKVKSLRTARQHLPVCALLALILAGAASMAHAQAQRPLLLRDPSLSKTQIAFSYAGNIWIANRDGGNLRRLTSGGHEHNPFFSPDGSQIAFTGDYDGTRGVYVVPAGGGEPRRLTYHPADFNVQGWTPDGRRILFTSARTAFADGVAQHKCR